MVIYNTDKTSKDSNKRLKIRNYAITFSTIITLLILLFTFIGLYTHALIKTTTTNNDHQEKIQAEKDSISSGLNLAVAKQTTPFFNDKYTMADMIIGMTQSYIFPEQYNLSPENVDKTKVFYNLDYSSINVISYTSSTVNKPDESTPNKDNWHTLVTTDFTISVQANYVKTSTVSYVMRVGMSFDFQGIYFYNTTNKLPIPLPPALAQKHYCDNKLLKNIFDESKAANISTIFSKFYLSK